MMGVIMDPHGVPSKGLELGGLELWLRPLMGYEF